MKVNNFRSLEKFILLRQGFPKRKFWSPTSHTSTHIISPRIHWQTPGLFDRKGHGGSPCRCLWRATVREPLLQHLNALFWGTLKEKRKSVWSWSLRPCFPSRESISRAVHVDRSPDILRIAAASKDVFCAGGRPGGGWSSPIMRLDANHGPDKRLLRRIQGSSSMIVSPVHPSATTRASCTSTGRNSGPKDFWAASQTRSPHPSSRPIVAHRCSSCPGTATDWRTLRRRVWHSVTPSRSRWRLWCHWRVWTAHRSWGRQDRAHSTKKLRRPYKLLAPQASWLHP